MPLLVRFKVKKGMMVRLKTPALHIQRHHVFALGVGSL